MATSAELIVPLDIPTIIAIIGGMGSLTYVLWKVIRRSDEKRLDDLERHVGEVSRMSGRMTLVEDKVSKIGMLFDKIIEIEGHVRRIDALDHSSESLVATVDMLRQEISKVKQEGAISSKAIEGLEDRVHSIGKTVEKMREDLADARETLMGFGKDFLTRKEYREDRRERSEANVRTVETRILPRHTLGEENVSSDEDPGS